MTNIEQTYPHAYWTFIARVEKIIRYHAPGDWPLYLAEVATRLELEITKEEAER